MLGGRRLRVQREKTIPLQGGLGNQLFELCAGFALRECLSAEIRFSTYWLDNPATGETARSLAVGDLLRADETTDAQVPRHGGRGDRIHALRVVETGPDDDALARVRPWTRYVAGYFQRLDYVDRAWTVLRGRLAGSSDEVHRILANPPAGDHGAVHMRLGDYLSNPAARGAHGVTTPDYYARAIDAVYRQYGVREWRLISDDLGEAGRRLASAGISPEISLQPVAMRDDWSELTVLATARTCVISNSSFSWWGAYFAGRGHGAPVIAPTPWFAHPTQSEPPIFPSSWVRQSRLLDRR